MEISPKKALFIVLGFIAFFLAVYWGFIYYVYNYHSRVKLPVPISPLAGKSMKGVLGNQTIHKMLGTEMLGLNDEIGTISEEGGIFAIGSTLTLKGHANDADSEKGKVLYLFSLLQDKEIWYVDASCTQKKLEKNQCSLTGVGSAITLKDGKAKISSVIGEDEYKLIEITGMLTENKQAEDIEDMIFIAVDSIRELSASDLPRPEPDRWEKFVELALKARDPMICKDKENNFPNNCIIELATILQDEFICPLMNDEHPGEGYGKDECYELVAYTKYDKGLCGKMSISYEKQKCLDNLSAYERAIAGSDTSICKTYETEYDYDNEGVAETNCIAEYAWQKKDLSVCDYYKVGGGMEVFFTGNENPGLMNKEWCIFRNAVLKKDSSQCSQIKDPFAVEICTREAGK